MCLLARAVSGSGRTEYGEVRCCPAMLAACPLCVAGVSDVSSYRRLRHSPSQTRCLTSCSHRTAAACGICSTLITQPVDRGEGRGGVRGDSTGRVSAQWADWPTLGLLLVQLLVVHYVVRPSNSLPSRPLRVLSGQVQHVRDDITRRAGLRRRSCDGDSRRTTGAAHNHTHRGTHQARRKAGCTPQQRSHRE